MQKKKFDLKHDLVQVDLGKNNNNDYFVSDKKINKKEESPQKKEKQVLLSIRVDEKFHKEYKIWCAKKGINMKDAFLTSFELMKKQYE